MKNNIRGCVHVSPSSRKRDGIQKRGQAVQSVISCGVLCHKLSLSQHEFVLVNQIRIDQNNLYPTHVVPVQTKYSCTVLNMEIVYENMKIIHCMT